MFIFMWNKFVPQKFLFTSSIKSFSRIRPQQAGTLSYKKLKIKPVLNLIIDLLLNFKNRTQYYVIRALQYVYVYYIHEFTITVHDIIGRVDDTSILIRAKVTAILNRVLYRRVYLIRFKFISMALERVRGGLRFESRHASAMVTIHDITI